ncbi:hypothetical protein MF672_038955 [Actinomadura sp. ATCC 31491]|uniref:DUF222 domain-containing protein n=1 Tax=Actinomadura luzonensis TaxID=2805427 RepID=A0ABT0G5E6_9ACTN|nr:hypothetical protein [Actinomadura luzonensis]MCK2219734.1 hypothetical protein [Actinomadura luzonensis]
MNEAGARWCEQHKRYECTKRSKRRPGDDCHASAIRGTNACRTHGGQKTEVLKAKGAALSAWRAVPGRQDVTPSEAVLAMLQMSWARVNLYASLLEQQVADAQNDGGGLGGSDDPDLGPGAGLIGHTRSGVKDIGIFATGEAARGLTLLEEKERDRCVRFAKTAHDMGIADREIRLAEQQGALIAGAISRILDALELTAAQRARVPEVVPGVLLEIAGEAGDRA